MEIFNSSIRCGRISYNNVLPLYYPLEHNICSHPFLFITAPPSTLNQAMRSGTLDLSPVSSVEYICNYQQYRIVPDLAIACRGEVMSVMLFSSLPIEKLHGKTVGMITESNTSVLLMKILFQELFSITPDYIDINHAKNHHCKAVLLIGDSALKEYTLHSYPYVYDLGSLWFEWTSLPFVFAVWVVSSTTQYTYKDLLTPFQEAQEWSVKNMKTIYMKAKENTGLADKVLQKYYSCLLYTLGEAEQQGMRYFIELLDKYHYSKVKADIVLLS